MKEIFDEYNDLVEQLSDLEHEQWIEYAKLTMQREKISEERAKRWTSLFVPYKDLSEEEKEKDRVYARRVVGLLNNLGYKK
jgi:hypothetical protein